MVNNNTEPELLVEFVRDGLVEQEHYGFIVLADRNRAFDFTGDAKSYPFFLRSCAKPLQASLLIDYGMDKFYDMTEAEIAICCASHAGEEIHVKTAKALLDKIGLEESFLKCGLHKPLSKTEQAKMLLNGAPVHALQNNCSGKHVMMLGLCKMKGWDLETYDKSEHPLQQAIKEQIYKLCQVKKEYPVTTDGCGVPIMSMPLTNMLHGYLNLFCNPKYEKIKVIIDERKLKYLMTKKTGDMKTLGLLNVTKEELEKKILINVYSNYIYNIEKNEFGDLKFNVLIELFENGERKNALISLKYIPEKNELRLITMF